MLISFFHQQDLFYLNIFLKQQQQHLYYFFLLLVPKLHPIKFEQKVLDLNYSLIFI